MRALSKSLVAVVCCLAVEVGVGAQTPVPGYIPPTTSADQRTTEVEVAPAAEPEVQMGASERPEVFAKIGEAPKPEPEPEAVPPGAIDPRMMVETMTNSVLNTRTGWDPTLGALTTGDATIDRFILSAGAKHGVDPKLVYSVMHQESGFKRGAVSNKGASGYMQLMPGTARRFGVTNIFDPQQNIDAGTKYLRFLLDLFGNNVELALAGYNAGEYRVIREGYRVPQIRETQNYVKVITSRYYGRAKRHFTVTYGKSSLSEKEREEIRLAAFATQDDRGTDSLSNIY
jgi:soluble lytic murein transglycosylase-like protein